MNLFEIYSKLDEKIVQLATQHQCYLIGGTAIDFFCRQTKIENWRSRSYNDLDFWCHSKNKKHSQKMLKILIQKMGFEVKEEYDFMITLRNETLNIDVDVLYDYDEENCNNTTKNQNIGVMNPIYLFVSKFDRYILAKDKERIEKDFYDLRVLLQIINQLNLFTEFSNLLENSPKEYTLESERKLNDIITNVYPYLK